MRAADASERPPFAESQRRRHSRSPGNGSASSGDLGEDASARPQAVERRRSASATPEQSSGRVKVLWTDPDAASRSRSAGRSSNPQRRAAKKSGRSARTNKQSARAASKPPGLPQAARALVQRVAEWDARVKSGEPALNPLAEIDASAVPLQSAFRSACADLLASYPETARKMDVDRRLWQNWYRDLERAQRLDSVSVREALGKCTSFYLDLVAQLEAKSKSANTSTAAREALQLSIQHSLVALGDVERYREQHVAGATNLPSVVDAWASAKEYYRRARAIAPHSGKVYNQLALVAARDGRFLEASYLYARSLGCQHPFPSRENLAQSLKKGALMSLSTNLFSDRRASMGASATLDKLHALLTRSADARTWRDSLESVRAAMQSLLAVESLLNDREYREQVATAIVQIVSVSLLLVYDTQSGNEPAFIATQSKLDFDTSDQAAMCALDLLFTVGTAILQQLSDFLQATSDYRQLQSVANVYLPGLNALLQWVQLHGWLPRVQSEASKLFNASCIKFHFALPSSMLSVYLVGLAATSDQELPEDLETKGFLPLDVARDHYSSAFPTAPSRSPPSKHGKGRKRADSPSSSAKKLFETRMARTVTLCAQAATMRDGAKRSTSLRAGAISRKKRADIDRLCSQCSNSSTFDGGACEFCGFEDDSFETSADSEDDEIVLSTQFVRGTSVTDEADRSGRNSLYGSSSTQAFGHYSSEVAQPHQSSSPPDPSSFAAVMAIGSQYSEFQGSFHPSQTRSKCLIVIDAPNVAMRHGMNQHFSSLGVRLAVDFFRALGHRVVAFIPDYMLKNETEQLAARRNNPRSANATIDSSSSSVSKIPNDIEMLRAMVQEGLLVPTPPQDYDDSYCIQYAGLHNGCVVTNDLFRDHVLNMEGPRERKEAMRAWLKAHQISFTWVRNEFLPNPNFRFPA